MGRWRDCELLRLAIVEQCRELSTAPRRSRGGRDERTLNLGESVSSEIVPEMRVKKEPYNRHIRRSTYTLSELACESGGT